MLLAYAATISAIGFLMFLVQPMAGKMILPKLGGEESLWSILLLSVGATRALAIVYAHTISIVLPWRKQQVFHIALWLPTLLFLLFRFEYWTPPEVNHLASLLIQFIPTVLMPIFLFTSSTILLQKWFMLTETPFGIDPYFLFSFSNLGSLLSVLFYPFLIEPNLTLSEQCWWWNLGTILTIGLIFVCAALVWYQQNLSIYEMPVNIAVERMTSLSPLHWVACTAISGVLLFCISTYLASELPNLPLIWTLPLALHLLSLVLTFMKWPIDWSIWPHRIMLVSYPIGLGLAVLLLLSVNMAGPVACGIYLSSFFVTVLVCHGILARNRPSPRSLTSYYLWMWVGEFVGGAVYSAATAIASGTIFG